MSRKPTTRPALLGPQLALAALFVACTTAAPPPPPPAPPPPIPLAKIADAMQAEIATMQKIYDLRMRSGRTLGELNAKIQRRGFSRRIPARPVVQGLESDLRAHARALGLTVAGWEVSVRQDKAPPAKVGPKLPIDKVWSCTAADLHGRIDARITLSGDIKAIVRFIDQAPNHVERAVLFTGQTPVPGGVRLLLQGFYERQPPRPKTTLRWPSLDDRLEAAGHKPGDPALAKDPAWPRLQQLDRQGRARTPDLRSVMDVANDFPRWLARGALFDEVTDKILKTRGAALFKATPIPPDAPFPPKQ